MMVETDSSECVVTNINKFFVLGCPRSGTTMLQQALNRHSKIVIPPETKFFFSFLGHCRECQLKHIKRLNVDLGIDIPMPNWTISSIPQARVFYDQMASLYLQRLKRTNIAYFGEKTPEHTDMFSVMSRCFPQAKYIWIYRDGRDVALSLTKVPWMCNDLYVNFAVWLYYSQQQRRIRRDTTLDVHFVKYEDLVLDPNRELSRIMEFLHLPLEPAVVNGHGNHEGIPKREYLWKSRALERINVDRIGTWRNELTVAQIAVLERLGAGQLRRLGYPLMTDGRRPLPMSFAASFMWHSLAFCCKVRIPSIVNHFLGGTNCFH